MVHYSIKDLENFTSIKAHTIRIWEQRYNLLTPKRTDTNIRYYTEDDLRKLLNINTLYNNGFKISKIAQLTESEINSQIEEILSETDWAEADHVEDLIKLIAQLDEGAIRSKLNQLAEDMTVEVMYPEVVIPTLVRVGELWQLGSFSISQEHLFSNLLREFFINKVSEIPSSNSPKGKVVLFLKEEENHELGLLFYYYFLKRRNFECYYLGQKVPILDLQTFVEQIKPDLLVTSMVRSISEKEFNKFFKGLETFFKLENVYAGGFQLVFHENLVPAQVTNIQSVDDLSQINV